MTRSINSLRDLFSGTPVVNPTLQELANERPPHTIYEQSGNDITARMPGETAEDHPAYPHELVAMARAQRSQVRGRLEAEGAGTYVAPPVPEFNEEEFHPPVDPNACPLRPGDVWPWPKE